MKHIIICLSVISLLFASCKTPKSATEIPVRVKSEVKKQYDRILEKHNEVENVYGKGKYFYFSETRKFYKFGIADTDDQG